jgi:hypothetical protein
MDGFLAFLVAAIVIVVGVCAFAVWACARVIGLILRTLVGGGRAKQERTEAARHARRPQLALAATPPWQADIVPCPQPNCRAANAPHARFCRRCGKAVSVLAAGAGVRSRPVPMRHVA